MANASMPHIDHKWAVCATTTSDCRTRALRLARPSHGSGHALRFSVRLIPYRIKIAYEPVQVKAFAIMALRPSIDCTGHGQPPCGHHPNCSLHPPPPQCQQRHHPISNRRPDGHSRSPLRTARPTQDTTSRTGFQRQSLELPHILKRHVVPCRKKVIDR